VADDIAVADHKRTSRRRDRFPPAPPRPARQGLCHKARDNGRRAPPSACRASFLLSVVVERWSAKAAWPALLQKKPAAAESAAQDENKIPLPACAPECVKPGSRSSTSEP